MSAPTVFDFAVIQVGQGTGPEVFTTICGITTTGFNRTVSTSDAYVRDCTSPALVPERRLKVNGHSRTLTGSGLANVDQFALLNSIEGVRADYKFIVMDTSDPTVTAGTIKGTWAGRGVATSIQMGTSDNNDATISITIESDGAWTYTAGS
jgi:hypothetical protein